MYDPADFYDHLQRARVEASFRPLSFLENMGGLLQNSITLAAMAARVTPTGCDCPWPS